MRQLKQIEKHFHYLTCRIDRIRNALICTGWMQLDNCQYRYKVIFMNRDLTEVVKSQQKMIGKDHENLPLNLFEAYKKHLMFAMN